MSSTFERLWTEIIFHQFNTFGCTRRIGMKMSQFDFIFSLSTAISLSLPLPFSLCLPRLSTLIFYFFNGTQLIQYLMVMMNSSRIFDFEFIAANTIESNSHSLNGNSKKTIWLLFNFKFDTHKMALAVSPTFTFSLQIISFFFNAQHNAKMQIECNQCRWEKIWKKKQQKMNKLQIRIEEQQSETFCLNGVMAAALYII